jgi:hypothetical protein
LQTSASLYHIPRNWNTQEGAGWPLQACIFAVSFLLVFSRRPDALLYPQFYGEDGVIWYTDAYYLGWFRPFLIPHTGYLQTLPRLAAALALIFPLGFAPLIMNCIGMGLQGLPVNLLLSRVCKGWSSLSARSAMAFVYLVLPNTTELNVSITEGQWHLALISSLLALGTPPKSKLLFLTEGLCILLCGLTGPFCIILLPIAFVTWLKRRDLWRLTAIGITAITSAIQLICLLQGAATERSTMSLGASFLLFCRMLLAQVYFGAIYGANGALHRSSTYVYSFVILGTAVLMYCAWKAQLELKLFIAYAMMIFTASLRSPMASYDHPQWLVMAGAWGVRYWFFPMLAFAWCLVWCATSNGVWFFRALSIACLAIFCLHIPRNWKYPQYPDLHFQTYARAFAQAPAGATVSIPICPEGWELKLRKK